MYNFLESSKSRMLLASRSLATPVIYFGDHGPWPSGYADSGSSLKHVVLYNCAISGSAYNTKQ